VTTTSQPYRRAFYVAIAVIIATAAVMSTAVRAGAKATAPVRISGAIVANDGTSESDKADLSILHAVVLGLVEGVTEYLPISSTGHLLVVERVLGLDEPPVRKDALDTYTVVIQIGAIAAVLGLYRKRVLRITEGLIGRSAEGRKLLIALLVAFVPAAIIGKGGESVITDKLLKPWPVVAAWIVGGVVLVAAWPIIAARPSRTADVALMTWQQALGIGAMQAIALWPGTSRSFVTILGGVLVGLSLAAAVEFAFLLGLLTLTAATAYSLLKDGSTLFDTFGIVSPIVGIVVAGVAAWLSVKWMVGFLNHRGLAPFGWYRIAAGAVTGVLLLTNVI
jgi:undecaprenyl-diphosphatase